MLTSLMKGTFYINTLFILLKSLFKINPTQQTKQLSNRQVVLFYYNNLLNNYVYYLIDILFIYITSINYKKSKFFIRWNIRLTQTNWSFYNTSTKNYYLGLTYLYNSVKYWLLGFILFITIFYYLAHVRNLQMNKILFEYFLLLMFFYWLISGFVFFIKKYQYSKFTSVIQRFWKRSYSLFWIIESNVFLVFTYLTLNATEEPVYMYDQVKMYKTHLFSWRWFFVKIIPVLFIMVLGYYLLISLKWINFSKTTGIFLIITLVIIYLVWLEFYQFFHIINFYGNMVWSFDADEYIWNLDLEVRRTRLVNNYTALCLMAKFWHLVFIFIFWVFFVLRINEINRARYTLLAANLQNFIILYIMSWIFMLPWLKYSLRKLYDNTMFWYFLNARDLGIRVFFNDIKLFIYSLFNFNEYLFNFYNYTFYYWIASSNQTGFLQYRKSVIRDVIIQNFNS